MTVFVSLNYPNKRIIYSMVGPHEASGDFGNAGGGKSALALELAAITGLPLYVLDKIKYRPGGGEVPYEEYLQAHTTLVDGNEWIIDGFGCIRSVWERFEAADTLIHVDLPLVVHVLWVTKRLVKGLFVAPEGWPENSPIIRSSIESYRVLWPCHSRLTPKYRSYVSEAAQRKRVFHLRSRRELKQFLEVIKNEVSSAQSRGDQQAIQPDGPASSGAAG
jgi:adenylate kinase family enzyme